jgi:hypothetical protein
MLILLVLQCRAFDPSQSPLRLGFDRVDHCGLGGSGEQILAVRILALTGATQV